MPAWTYPMIKTAATTAPIDVMSDDDAVIALNAQTTPTPTDPSTMTIRKVLAASGEQAMGVISLISDGITSTVTANTAMTVICRTFMDAMDHHKVLDGIDSGGWADTQKMFGKLEEIGVISNATNISITAIQLPAIPDWDPPLTLYDVNVARNYY